MMNELHFVPICVLDFYLGVTRCPDGAALFSTHLRNRGHDDWPEITCWPGNHHNRLTTGREYCGLGQPEQVRLNETEKQICAILGLNELELGIFLREWTPIRSGRKKGGLEPLLKKPETLEEVRSALWLLK